jgi:dihydroorotase
MAERLSLTRPDDCHLHLRDGDALRHTVAHSALRFARAIVMPNLDPPVVTTEQALAYRERILAAVPEGLAFEPLMTLYLTDNTPPAEIQRARQSGVVHAVKYYPAGATTNSENGVTDLTRCYRTLEEMAKAGLPLLVHGEVTDPEVDVFDREAVFIDRVLLPLMKAVPGLKVVFEHITTRDAAALVADTPKNLAATLTPQHLLLNRNALFRGGIRPHHYCLPVLKRESHRQALVAAATSGDPRFFLGTDSAPHARERKENACGCAGMFSAPAAIELYAQLFEQVGALERLEAFAAHHGADFYGLPRNRETLTLERSPWQVPENLPFGQSTVVPMAAGETLDWRLVVSA